MKRRRVNKSLEKAARAVKDSDEFVGHIAGVAERYRREHALDAGLRSTAMRQSLKTFRKHAAAVADWLDRACASRPGIESDALAALSSTLQQAPTVTRAGGKNVLDWLSQADAAAARCLGDAKLLPRKPQKNAPRIAAEGLRATFEHHQLKLSTAGSREQPSALVALLCAIAKSAGDTSLTLADAKRALVEAGKPKAAVGSQAA